MKLYYFPGSCALAPHIVLNWVGADFGAIRIEKGDPEYRKVNPLGVVPALDYEGRIYTQADAILHWLADMFPDHALGGGGTPDANYELNNWLAFLTGDFHPAFFPFFNTQRYTTDDDEASLAAVKHAAEARVGGYMDFFEAHMEGRDFIVGNSRSIPDAYAVPMLRWVRLLSKKLDQYPALDAYLARMQDDPAVERALAEQGLKK
jgi:glutathione S-transferase